MSDESPGQSLIAGSSEVERRQGAARTNLLMSATIDAGDVTGPVRIRNLSETGALIEGAALPKAGAHLVLRRLQLEMGGTVIWSAGGRCGVRFDGIISVAGWRSGNWIAPLTASDQARVDGIQAAARAGSLPFQTGGSPSASMPDLSDRDIDLRIAQELAALRRLLETMGEQLSDQPAVVQHCSGALQGFDLACQTLGHLVSILNSNDRRLAINAVGMEELRQRLRRKPASGS